MFQRLHDPAAPTVTFTFEGEALVADARDTVAAALLAADAGHTRTTPVSGARRAPFCMMGACFECLVEIDGLANQQACMIPVRAGMKVRRQVGARRLDP
jgi:predicted molibdopterin-dependent oxidoreductase YjgC